MPFLWKFPFSGIHIYMWNIFIYIYVRVHTHTYIHTCIYKFFDYSVNTNYSLLSMGNHGKRIDEDQAWL